MAQLHKGEGQIQLKCHADKFFDLWAHKLDLLPQMCPNKVAKVELLQGEFDKAGAVLSLSYHLNDIGQHATVKTKIEEIDEINRFVRYSYHDGLMMSYYKNFMSKIEVIPNIEGCIIRWSFEYKKMNEDSPEPHKYADYMLALALDVAKDIGARLYL